MAFKNILTKLRRAVLCCRRHKQIGSPTNVRRVDISDALPGLTDAERKYIREKASSDAIHLLGLQSQPTTSPPSPTCSSLSAVSCEPSEALLNAASKDLPSALPTPPRQTHSQSSPPAVRMKSMWENSEKRSLSTSSSSSTTTNNGNEGLYGKFGRGDEHPRIPEAKNLNESFSTLNLEFAWEDKTESPRMLSLSEGFEVADTVGGAHAQPGSVRSKIVQRVVAATCVADSSGSDSDSDSDTEDGGYDVAVESNPFQKI